MSDFSKELDKILRSPHMASILKDIEKQEATMNARNLRNDVQADWLSSFMQTMIGKEDSTEKKHQINKQTGKPHTVQSMVEEYKSKIGLERKTSSLNNEDNGLPLSSKQAVDENQELWEKIVLKISEHLGSHRGYSDPPAIIYELRDFFGENTINDFHNKILKEIERQKNMFYNEDIRSQLPRAPTNMPQKVDTTTNEENDMFKGMLPSLSKR